FFDGPNHRSRSDTGEQPRRADAQKPRHHRQPVHPWQCPITLPGVPALRHDTEAQRSVLHGDAGKLSAERDAAADRVIHWWLMFEMLRVQCLPFHVWTIVEWTAAACAAAVMSGAVPVFTES